MSDENILNQEANNPSSANGIFDVLSKLMKGAGTTPQDSAPAEKPTAEPNIVSSLLSNPELISKLPELISVISPLMSGLSSQSTSGGATDTLRAAISPVSAVSNNNVNREQQNRAALLCALKPYLKKERQDAIDYMIKLSRLGDILKTL